jgi:hypothetical protein
MTMSVKLLRQLRSPFGFQCAFKRESFLCVCVCVALVHSEAQAKTQLLLTGGPAVSGRQEQQVNPLSAWNILVAAKPIVLSSFVCGRFASR